MSALRVLVSGGRDYTDRNHLRAELDRVVKKHGRIHIISGGATGADTLALEWAKDRCMPRTIYPAEWTHRGPSAGPIRNQEMIDDGKPDLFVPFPGGPGTADMTNRATVAGIRFWQP